MTHAKKRTPVTMVCPYCGSARFIEMRDACISVRISREVLGSGEPWDRKFFVGVDDYGSALYMMTCAGCGHPLETDDLVVPGSLTFEESAA